MISGSSAGRTAAKDATFLVVTVGTAIHVQLFGSAGLAADTVAGHIGILPPPVPLPTSYSMIWRITLLVLSLMT